MDSLSAFARGDAARAVGAKLKVFDWDKAASIIKEKKAEEASAGLEHDWDWTGGDIFRDGKPYKGDYTFLASVWATPQLEIDGEYIDCWKHEEETPGWNSDTKWPKSALEILNK
jgi:hypothetical protein